MSTLTAAELSPLTNGFKIAGEPPRRITVPNASKLVGLQEVTVSGVLLPRQLVRLDPVSNQRAARSGGDYHVESNDGDLHFCLGTAPLEPHIGCELQNAKAWIATFKKFVGQAIEVTGFFRCLFEHPGFRKNDDAHVFEIHPVRAVTLGGKVYPFDVDVPDQAAIHAWTTQSPVNKQDQAIKVTYGGDTLVFEHMNGADENYVRLSGSVSNIHAPASGSTLPSFSFTSPAVGHPLKTYCLPGSSAARQLQHLKTKKIKMVALRNIDLDQATKGRYLINLLAIDITGG